MFWRLFFDFFFQSLVLRDPFGIMNIDLLARSYPPCSPNYEYVGQIVMKSDLTVLSIIHILMYHKLLALVHVQLLFYKMQVYQIKFL